MLQFIILIILLIILFLILKKEEISENFNIQSINYIKKLNKKNTVIIVGKGPNLNDFIDNYNLYEKFDKLGLNNSILLENIKFKYYFQQDFHINYNAKYMKKMKSIYSNKIKSNVSKNKIKQEDNINYAVKNNIIPIIPKIKYDNGKTPSYNILPKFITKSKKCNYVNFLFSNKIKEISIEKDKIILHRKHPPSCAVTAILYLISIGYKNILLTGITMYNKEDVKKKYLIFLEKIKKKFDDVEIICLYPTIKSKNVFDLDIL